jgi:hypothetical protein
MALCVTQEQPDGNSNSQRTSDLVGHASLPGSTQWETQPLIGADFGESG